jgi:hypothetical protein
MLEPVAEALARVRASARTRTLLTVSVVLTLGVVAFFALVVRYDVHFFRAKWLLMPDETGMLLSARYLADHGSLKIDDPWYFRSPAHLPEGVATSGEQIVPRKAIGGYLVYAAAFRVSDDAWTYVGPFFGIVAVVSLAAIVYLRTGSYWPAALAGLVFGTSSPFIIWASGLAFDNIIAAGLFFLSVALFELYLRTDRLPLALAGSVSAGFAVLVRNEFIVGVALTLAVVLWSLLRTGKLKRQVTARPLVIAVLLLLVALVPLMNYYLYRNPLHTGYPAGAWQSSLGGIARSLVRFRPGDFYILARSYLVEIGLPTTVLLLLGIAASAYLKAFHRLDVVLLGFAAFLLYFYLGKRGSYGSNDVWLVSSYPRYILPVYGIGAALGAAAIWRVLSRLRLQPAEARAVVMWVALVAMSIGIREAFTNERGVSYVEYTTGVLHSMDRVASEVPDTVVVSDVHGKGVIDGRALTPRLLRDPSQITGIVANELDEGHRVLVDADNSHPLYSGYLEYLEAAGFRMEQVSESPSMLEVSGNANPASQ